MIKKAIILSTAVLTGCTTVNFTKTGLAGDFGEQSKDCNVVVFTTHPNKPFTEVGIIEFGGYTMEGVMNGPSTVGDLLSITKETVCRNGGNGILAWEANSLGNYKKATVIKIN